MIDWIYPIILVGAGLIVVSGLTSVVAFRFGAPLLLVFLGIGLLAGEDGFGIHFDDATSAYFIGSLALAVILFDSGFGTRLTTFRRAAAPALTLATLGVALTTALVGLAARFAFGLPWHEALLIGAIVSSTDAAAVFFLLRVGGITVRERVRATLEIESGSNDPMAIFLTVTLVELIAAGGGLEDLTTEFLVGFGLQMGLGVALGLAGGGLIVQLANRIELEGALYPIVVLGAALCLFALTGAVGGSGFLAVYVAGLVAGNRRLRGAQSLRRFQDGMTWLAQIVMFLTLGLLATPSEFPAIALPAIGLALFLTFVARPLAIGLCLLPFGYRGAEIGFVAWVGLRGAVSILLAILPFIGGLANAQLYFNAAFIIVLTSLLVQGWTVGPLARRLGLIAPPDSGTPERIELELPGHAHHELVAYRVAPGCPVLRGEPLPPWAQPALVIRDGRSMGVRRAGRLRAGDCVYIFTAPHHAPRLDRLFTGLAPDGTDSEARYGEQRIDPRTSVAALRAEHGIDIAPSASPETSVGEFVRERLRGRAAVGDRVRCGTAELIVRDIDDRGRIVEVDLVRHE